MHLLWHQEQGQKGREQVESGAERDVGILYLHSQPSACPVWSPSARDPLEMQTFRPIHGPLSPNLWGWSPPICFQQAHQKHSHPPGKATPEARGASQAVWFGGAFRASAAFSPWA